MMGKPAMMTVNPLTVLVTMKRKMRKMILPVMQNLIMMILMTMTIAMNQKKNLVMVTRVVGILPISITLKI